MNYSRVVGLLVGLWVAQGYAQEHDAATSHVEAPQPSAESAPGEALAPAVEAVPAEAPAGELAFDFADLDLEAVLGQVSAASGKAESLLVSPASITVLDEEDFYASAARTVPDLLRMVPGIQVVQVAPGNYQVSTRGTGGLVSNNLIVVLDGVPMNNPFDGNVDWASLSVAVEDLERIEVVRGPVSPIYGADAFTGVVVLTTRGAASSKENLRARLGFAAGGDVNGRTGYLQSASLDGKEDALEVTVKGHARRDSLFSRYEVPTSSGGLEVRRGPPLSADGLNARLGYQASEHTRFELVTGASQARANALDSLVLEARQQTTRSAYIGMKLASKDLFSSGHSFTLWSDGRYVDRQAATSDYTSFNYDDTKSYKGRLGINFDFKLPADASLQLGFESGVVNADAPFLHPDENNKPRFAYAARLHANMRLADMFVLEAAARGDVSAFTQDPQLSGRASVIYYNDLLSLRLSAGSAFRNPTYVEVGSRFIDPSSGLILLEGAHDLGAPRNDSLELGATVGWLEQKLTVRPTVFVQRLTNLVVGDFEPLARKTYRNDARSIGLAGAELETEYGLTKDVSLSLAATALDFRTAQDDPSATIGEKNHNSDLMGRLGFRGRFVEDRLLLGAAATYASERSYNVRAGIPPVLLPVAEVDAVLRFEGSAEYRAFRSMPLWFYGKVSVQQPGTLVEAAYPDASQLGSWGFVGVAYRS